MADTKNTLRNLSPDFEQAFMQVLRKAQAERWPANLNWPARWLGSRAEVAPSPEGPRLEDVLERHDPCAVTKLAAAMRHACQPIEYKQFPYVRGYLQTQYTMGVIARISPGAILAMTTDSDGFLRQAAVDAVPRLTGAFGLALLFLRLNDWVFEVRLAAERKFAALTRELPVEDVITCVELLLQEEQFGRMSEGGRICVHNLVERNASALTNLIWTTDAARALRLIKYGLRMPYFDAELERLALSHPNPRVRAIVAYALLKGEHEWSSWKRRKRAVSCADRNSLASKVLADRSTAVQAPALAHFVHNEIDWPTSRNDLAQFLLSGSARLASLAQFSLQKRGIDWLKLVRENLTSNKSSRGAARILAQDGNESDATRMRELVTNVPDAKALPLLTAAARLGDAPARDRLLWIALDQPDLPLARRAAGAVLQAAIIPPTERLIAVIERGEFDQRGLRKMQRRLSFFAQVEVLCALESAGFTEDLVLQIERLRHRMNRAALITKPDQRERLAAYAQKAPRARELIRKRLAIDLTNVP